MQRSSVDGIFLGRDRQLSDFDRFLQVFLSTTQPSPRPQIVLISGQGGIGKSTLLRAFEDRLGPQGPFRPVLLKVDWHEEQKREPHRFPSVAEQVSAQAVFAVIDRQASSFPVWTKARKAYETAQEQIAKVKAKVEKARASSRDLGTSSAVPDLVAKTAGEAAKWAGGPLAKPLVEALVKLGVESAPQWIESIRAKLSPSDIDLLEGFEQHLARGLGRSLAALAESVSSRRLLVFLDTYEIVDERDPLVREVIRMAGAHVGWVIAGRRDLYSDRAQTPRGRFDGYVVDEGHDWDLRPIDVKALAREEIRTFFRQAAPDRTALEDEDLERIHRATGAIPLAIRLAAEIWVETGAIEQIVAGENAPQEKIVEEMVARYEQHCVDQDLHRLALAAIAMAEGDVRLLDALLLPEPGIDGQERALRDLLALVHHRYASVMKESSAELRLHDEPARFYRKKMCGRRHEGWVQAFNQRAIAHLLARLKEPWSYHETLESLYSDDEFQLSAVRLANHLFWLDEAEAWPWFTARFVEGMGYSSELREGLLDIAEAWRIELKGIGRKRLEVLRGAEDRPWVVGPLQARRHLLEADEKRGWLDEARFGPDRFAGERRAIRLGSAAESLSREERPDDALSALRQAEPDVPSGGQLAQEMSDLALRLCFDFYERSAKRGSRSQIEVCELAVRLTPSSSGAQGCLGTAHAYLKEFEKALEQYKRAIELNPQDRVVRLSLGNVYVTLREYEKAIEHHQKVIELDPHDGEAWQSLGDDYSCLKNHEKAIEHYRKSIELNFKIGRALCGIGKSLCHLCRYHEASDAIHRARQLDPEEALVWLWSGYLDMVAGKLQEAFSNYRRALELGPEERAALRLWAHGLYRNGDWQGALAKAQEAEDWEVQRAPLTLLALQKLVEKTVRCDPEKVEENVALEGDELVAAQWFALQGKDDDALTKLGEAIARTPFDAVRARFMPAFHEIRFDPRFVAMTSDAPGASWSDFPPQTGSVAANEDLEGPG